MFCDLVVDPFVYGSKISNNRAWYILNILRNLTSIICRSMEIIEVHTTRHIVDMFVKLPFFSQEAVSTSED